MNIENKLQESVIEAVLALYGQEVTSAHIQLQKTKKEFEGHLTLVAFTLVKISRKGAEQTAQEIGQWLVDNSSEVTAFNVIKGFLNLSVATSSWLDLLNEVHAVADYGISSPTPDAPLVMIEYSSPNTNKPLHLGHVRNNLLGFSLAEVLKANGYKVVKTNIVNDRGVHICKSMLAWHMWGKGETPQSSGKKGDHLVGDYYVLFDKKWKKQIDRLYWDLHNGVNSKKDTPKKLQSYSKDVAKYIKTLDLKENFKQHSLINEFIDTLSCSVQYKKIIKDKIDNWVSNTALLTQAQKMLFAWEAGDKKTIALWEMMNTWVYAGFDETYKKLGVDFEKIYYESQTYLNGKETVLEGLEKGIFFQKEDGSVWADLTADGMDQKLLLRSDGTSVYMTQDIGTAKLRFDDYPINKMVYVVGNEQNYHFQVLSILLDKLGFDFGKGLVHFSYGMVELPEGKMKSREGTVVDADDLVDEMVSTAKETSKELGKLDGCTDEEANEIARIVGMGALKYFILKVDPKKNMTFNPKESIDFNGNTGPFIQYTYARIRSIVRKAGEQGLVIPSSLPTSIPLTVKEENLVQLSAEYAAIVKQAGSEYNPSLIANYIYDLVKEYNQFYHEYSILKEENPELKNFRLVLSLNVAKIIKSGMSLLGIEVPERM